MGQHPPRQGAKVLVAAATVGKSGEAPHDSFLDLGATCFAWLHTLGIGTGTFTFVRSDLVPITSLDPLLIGAALAVAADTLGILHTFVDFLASLGPRGLTLGIGADTFTFVGLDLITIASLDPLLIGRTFHVGAETVAVVLLHLYFLPCLGLRLAWLTVGVRATGLAGGLLNLGPGLFLRLHHLCSGVV